MSRIDAGHDGAGHLLHSGDGSESRRERELDEVVIRLLIRFGDRIPRPQLEYLVREAAADFDDARIRSFVPILIEHEAAERIHATLRRRPSEEQDLGAAG